MAAALPDHDVFSGDLRDAAFAVQLPTGEYMDDKLINLGTNQYVVRPDVGLVHDRGRWSIETGAVASFYSMFGVSNCETD